MPSERSVSPLARAAWLCGLAAAMLAAPALPQPVGEPELKAAFVYNFAVFTEWPREALAPGMPLLLCASPDNAMLGALGQLRDKLVNGHRIALRPALAPVSACHVLVLTGADRERWARLKHELAGAAVLTVSDDMVISADGAVIGLSDDERRIGFDVDLGAARLARLVLSSKLLRLARSVQ